MLIVLPVRHDPTRDIQTTAPVSVPPPPLLQLNTRSHRPARASCRCSLQSATQHCASVRPARRRFFLTPASGALQISSHIVAELDLNVEIANRSEDSCGTQVEGTVGARHVSAILLTFVLEKFVPGCTLPRSLNGSLEELIEVESALSGFSI